MVLSDACFTRAAIRWPCDDNRDRRGIGFDRGLLIHGFLGFLVAVVVGVLLVALWSRFVAAHTSAPPGRPPPDRRSRPRCFDAAMADRYLEITIESREQWRAWLDEHHATAPGVWVTTYKRQSGRPQVSIGDIVEEALAYGWIDNRPRSVHDQRYQRLVTPRKPANKWSRVNKQRVNGLIASGAMTPAGIAAVELAKRTGMWTALDEVEELREPPLGRVPALDQTRDPRVDRERQEPRDPRKTHHRNSHPGGTEHPRQPMAPTQAGYRTRPP